MQHKQCDGVTRMAGVSLTELCVSLAVLGLLLSLAIPAFNAQRRDTALVAATNQWLAWLQRARLESIALGRPVVLCPSAGTQPAACTNGLPWSTGFLLFVDDNRNGAFDGQDVLLRQETPSHRWLRIRGNGSVSRYVNFHADGVARRVSGAFQAGTFTVCVVGETDPRFFRQLVLSAAGRVRIDRPAGPQPVCAP